MSSLISSFRGIARRGHSLTTADISQVRKTYFNPLLSTKDAIIDLLKTLPIGSAHPYSQEKLLLLRTTHGVQGIDISQLPEDYFFNAVDLGEMGEVLLERMARFKDLKIFEDFQIQQAPSSTFSIPIVKNKITILAVSERKPTYYDFCFADESNKVCCFNATGTFAGLQHSGDILAGNNGFLAHVTIDPDKLVRRDLCVFISGYNYTPITKFLGTHPALLVANHVEKVLYIVPVPLDEATIGQATLCCPLVIRGQGDTLLCSILPTATTDTSKMAAGAMLDSPCFKEALGRADFVSPTASEPLLLTAGSSVTTIPDPSITTDTKIQALTITTKKHVVIATSAIKLPGWVDDREIQLIEFGTGLDFRHPGSVGRSDSTVVLPCLFGTQLEGPLLLATGTIPENVPFVHEKALLGFYQALESAIVFVDERMTDNARNLAGPYRMNAVYIVQVKLDDQWKTGPLNSTQVLDILNATNVNAVTALAGPQSLVLAQIHEKYYYYRGLANRERLDTSRLAFGTDITSIIDPTDLASLVEPRAKRMINLTETNTILLLSSGRTVKIAELKPLFDSLAIEGLLDLVEDISAIVPQLQILLNQKDLADLSTSLISVLAGKVGTIVTPLRKEYVAFVKQYNSQDMEDVKKKNRMLGELRKRAMETQKALEPVISALANMMSVQTTSKRTHDLKRLVRQAQIANNVEATKNMTFETLAGYLESHAIEMGVMLCNIKSEPYRQLLDSLKRNDSTQVKTLAAIDASTSCELDSRILHLEGFDAGIIIEQSQLQHNGPLANQEGPLVPTLALPYLSQDHGTGSMISWVCWDEFVSLESPYTVRWMEKCNEPHIAAVRIITRSTLANAIASREYNFESSNVEIGHLMSALLMSGMTKLAAMRMTIPPVQAQANDTVVKLMRGLFGNFLTIAGSGTRPLSMVWQLFGMDPQLDLPSTDADWIWYEQAAALFPYTGWPAEQFLKNLEKLLDKAIIRVVTKGEDVKAIKSNRAAELIAYCRQRNIQLDHSRTIITVLKQMLTVPDADIPAIATRLLSYVPETLPRKTQSYTRMIQYLRELAAGQGRNPSNDEIIASVHTKRSAAFGKCKTLVAEAATASNWPKATKYCQALLDEHSRLAKFWAVDESSFEIQNIKPYKELLAIDTKSTDPATITKLQDLVKTINSDAERTRVPWQVGKKGQFGTDIEPLHEGFVQEILTGQTKPNPSSPPNSQHQHQHQHQNLLPTGDLLPADNLPPPSTATPTAPSPSPTSPSDILASTLLTHTSSLRPQFIKSMQTLSTVAEVCSILSIPESALRVFGKAFALSSSKRKMITPTTTTATGSTTGSIDVVVDSSKSSKDVVVGVGDDHDEQLVMNFKLVVAGLIEDRSGREGSLAARRVFGGGDGGIAWMGLAIE